MRKKNKFKSFRYSLGWEQERLSKELGVSRGAVSNWELGSRKPSLSSLRKMRDIAKNNGINFDMNEFTKDKY